MKKRLLALLLAVAMCVGVLAACQPSAEPEKPAPAPAPAPEDPAPAPEDEPAAPAYGRDPYVAPDVDSNVPRNETLYFNGIQWGVPNAWNPFHANSNNLANDQNGGGTRTMVWETPYMFNGLDGKMYPLLADGDYSWSADGTEIVYKIKKAAYWSDGTKVTAHDAAFTWEAGMKYTPGQNGNWTPFIDDVIAADDETVVVKAALTGGKPSNGLMVTQYIGQNYILQKAWLEGMIDRCGGDPVKVTEDPGFDFVWSGPYTRYFDDDTRIILIRDDGYWGQHEDMWGKLPAPKYLGHMFYADNAAGDAALVAGEIDVSQQFIANVQDLWEKDGLPFSTYIDKPPYGLCVNMPTAWYNMAIPVLQEVEIRQAIAWAVDYDLINANAMTGQSPTFAEVPRSLMNPTPGEQALLDKARLAPLQWVGNDIEGANKLLDDSGKFPKGSDGWRTYEGKKISLVASCPYGWSDWEASMEIVAAAGEKIGIEITTFFPEWDVYGADVTGMNQTEYHIFMMWTNSVAPSEPWGRIRNLLSSEFVPPNWEGANWNGNWGGYVNPECDRIIAAIPLETDEAKLKELYNDIVEIYLTEVPSFSLMYRPDKFHLVNESVWTGFTEQGDGRNVPPFNCVSGYAIKDLFDIYLVG